MSDKEEILNEMVEMISAMARLDFSRRLDIEITNEPINLIAFGLNMLSEELENNIVIRSNLEEINSNLEKFSYTVAHDIKSPLNSSKGIISLIEDEVKQYNNQELNEYIEILKSINDRTRSMIKGILKYSKSNATNITMTAIDLNEICTKLAREYILKKEIRFSIEADMPKLVYNESALIQILSNLISNAIKFNDKEVCEISIFCKERAFDYMICVQDNGPGIGKQNMKSIFDLFENLQSINEESTGIGLSIVKKIIMEMNGEIWVESSLGEGSKFFFTIQKTTLSKQEKSSKHTLKLK
ncbi:ATP-binding protein [Echinicola sp. 20G]|uniref:sensor histidine kinase n=1 Tax=Echinicola sp. 20G TaxID=2781961 RepID=UPI00190FD8DC|nr:ATP-binding protein [Echinicola sp. 20G]